MKWNWWETDSNYPSSLGIMRTGWGARPCQTVTHLIGLDEPLFLQPTTPLFDEHTH